MMFLGGAIIGVIAIHVSSAGLALPNGSFAFYFTLIWRNLINFSVPLFIFISGYFMSKKEIKNCREYLYFLKKQVPRVLIPMWIYSALWIVAKFLVGNINFYNEILKLITFRSSGIYYFVALIVQFYLLTPFLTHMKSKKSLLISVSVSLLMTILILYCRYFIGLKMPLLIYAGNFLTWLMFFVLGIYCRNRNIIKTSNKNLLLAIFIFFIISIGETIIYISFFNKIGDAVTAIKPSSFLYSFFLILFMFKNIRFFKAKFLAELGRMSFGIYLSHLFLLIIFSKILGKLGFLLKGGILYQISLIIITIIVSFICISIFNKLANLKISRYLGFR